MKLKTLYSKLFILLALHISSLLFSCQQVQKTKVGFLLPDLVLDRYAKEKSYFTDRMNELGSEALIEIANDDDKLQIQQANELIAKGVKVLIVNPVNLYTSAEIVRSAHNHRIKVIAYDRLICNTDLDYYLSFDNEKVGILMADYVIKKVPEGKYLIFGGDKGDLNAGLVMNGQMKILEQLTGSGKIKIDYNIYVEDWSAENARHELKIYLNLSGEQPDVILSSNDGMAIGIVETLKEFGMEGKVLVTGQDAELAACQNIVKGYQIMTVYKPLKKLAYTAADLSFKLIKSKELTEAISKVNNGRKDVPSILLEPISVDKYNLKSTVIADGFLSESDVYKP